MNRLQQVIENDFTDCLEAEGTSTEDPEESAKQKCRSLYPDDYEDWEGDSDYFT